MGKIHTMNYELQWLPLLSSHPGFFGKVGMRHYHMTTQKYYCPSVNLDRLWSLVSEQTREQYAKKTDVAPVIDVVRAVSLKTSWIWQFDFQQSPGILTEIHSCW